MINYKGAARKASCDGQRSLHLRLIASDVNAVKPIWQAIEERAGAGGLANSWAWTETWLRHYGDLVPHHVVIGERHGIPCAITLLTEGVGQRIGPIPVRTLHIGTAGEPDDETIRVQYNRVLADPVDRVEFTRLLPEFAARSELRWDEFHLNGFAPEDAAPILDHDRTFIADRVVNYVTELAVIRARGGTVLSALHGDSGKKIRRSSRRFEETFGPVKIEWAETLEQARSMFDEMCVLHQARWQAAGDPGVFASPRFTGFHTDIVERLFHSGGIALARVSAGDVTIGCDYSFIERNRLLGYQWGLGSFEDKRLSPGLVTAVTVMQSAMERGLHEYDHLAGDILYKHQLSTTARSLIWARAPRGARIQVIYKLAEAKRLARRLPARQKKAAGRISS